MRDRIRRAASVFLWSLSIAATGLLLGLLPALEARAHELRPAIVDMTFAESGAVTVRASLNLEAFMLGISGAHADTADAPEAARYDALREEDPKSLDAAFRSEAERLLSGFRLAAGDGEAALSLVSLEIGEAPPELPRISTLTLTADLPAAADLVAWRDGGRLGDVVLRAWHAGESDPLRTQFVRAGELPEPIELTGRAGPDGWATFADYLPVGFDHILPKGLDHIVFVIGLFLLSPHLRPLLAQVTMFTLAHSVTLALGLFGVVRIAPAIVEPLIAASIVFIAVENLFTTRLSRWRPAVVFGFGLLHGLGFAGVLAEFGLPDGQYVPALIGFNLGVELGQLTVLALCFLTVGLWFRKRDWYHRVIARPASLSVAAVGAFWVVERVL